jgi:exodeoxyribonuclease V gamma subunit
MPAFNVFFSNRLEILGEQLARIVRTPLSSPLTAEIIVVQSRGMERWISM